MSVMSSGGESTTDPCNAGNTFSALRFFAFFFLFVIMIGGGGTLFFLLRNTLCGVQLATAVSYTAAVMVYGFAKNRNGIRAYLFTCPVVMSQYPRLLKLHAEFLAFALVFETIALRIEPHLSAWWFTSRGRNWTPFYTAVALPVAALAIIEVMTNRRVLKRAHQNVLGGQPAQDTSGQDDMFSITGRG